MSFIVNEIKSLLGWRKYQPLNCMPHGHFYSPITSRIDIDSFQNQIWEGDTKALLPDINLRPKEQLALLEAFSNYYKDIPFKENKIAGDRYYFNNSAYRFTDAIVLYSFIRHFNPKRIIEVGSGFSSALMIDVNEKFNKDIKMTFIEPYPQLLRSLTGEKEMPGYEIVESKVQAVPLDRFKELEENDILFIDSSHVSKTGSDVNHEIFSILPLLKKGVLIHFHDIFYPFEYPKQWVYEGRNWNECYLLRAFLSYNASFEILLFSDYMHKHHRHGFDKMPLSFKDTGGNLWMRRI